MKRAIRYIHYYIIGSLFVLLKKPMWVHGNLIFFPKGTDKIIIGASLFGKYEMNEKKLINKFLNPNSKVLELGGNIGGISNFINKKIIEKEDHIVLEPNPNILSLLKKNKNLNKSKFKIINGILSTKKINKFYLSKNTLGSTTIKNNDKYINVDGFTLDEISSFSNIKFDALVMDIEGGEFDFLKNFNISQFETIILELHNNKLSSSEINFCLKKLNLNHKLIESKGKCQVWKLR